MSICRVLAGVGLSMMMSLPVAGGARAACTVTEGAPSIRQQVYVVADAAQRDATLQVIRERADEMDGSAEITIRPMGTDRILVERPKDMAAGLLFAPGAFGFHRVLGDGTQPAGPDGRVVRSIDGRDVLAVETRPTIGGERIERVEAGIGQAGEPVVTFRLDAEGARQFGQFTSENIGQPFAIVLDGTLISAPVIRGPILGGSGLISGSFTAEEARDLAILLRTAMLPGTVNLVEDHLVGPRPENPFAGGALVLRIAAGTEDLGAVCRRLAPIAPGDVSIRRIGGAAGEAFVTLEAGDDVETDPLVASVRGALGRGVEIRSIERIGPLWTGGTAGWMRRLKGVFD